MIRIFLVKIKRYSCLDIKNSLRFFFREENHWILGDFRKVSFSALRKFAKKWPKNWDAWQNFLELNAFIFYEGFGEKKFPDYLLLKISNGFSKILDVVFDAFLKFAKKKPKSLTTSEKHQKCILCAITKDLVKKK